MSNPAIYGYGIATLAFLAFAVHLSVGFRGGAKASILLGAVLASAAWAGANAGFSLTGSRTLWATQAVLDALRVGGWLLFLAIVLQGVRFGLKAGPALLLLPVAAGFFYPNPTENNSKLIFAITLAVAVAGLALTEQVYRRSREGTRWAIKPLCLGLGAGFVFDLYIFAEALLFGRIDSHLWAARGFAHALVIPFIAIATARNRDWTIDIALSRGVVFHSTAIVAC